MVSEWSATCSAHGDPMSCVERAPEPGRRRPTRPQAGTAPAPPDYAWTDLTYLLHGSGVSWGYYVVPGTEPDCDERRR